MINNTELWIKRAAEVQAKWPSRVNEVIFEAVQFATSMLSGLYGPQSVQLRVFLAGQEALSKMKAEMMNIEYRQGALANGAISNALAELRAGLIVSVRVLVAGEIFGDLVFLGKELLEDRTEASKNVASVLVAAAFEDIMRRMGGEFAGIVDRPKLDEIIIALKNTDVIRGGQVAIAQSFLKFRNDSLHADWARVDRSQVQACVGFIEELLSKHFS